MISGMDIQFGIGNSIIIDKNSILKLGSNVSMGANNKIICRNNIIIGNNYRAAWDVQIFDTNFHYIKNIEDGSVSRRENKVIIGNNNWFGNRSSIMPGTITNDFFIAASNSLCNKDYTNLPKYSLVGGSPAKLLKTNVVRVLDREAKEIAELFKKSDDRVIYVNPEPRVR
jgi:acetyltransferase-like isoleucine patch superfamily enzyme